MLLKIESGKVFGWGNSEYGQLPVQDDNFQVNAAIELSDCSEFGRIVDIAAGGSFCMVLSGNLIHQLQNLSPFLQKPSYLVKKKLFSPRNWRRLRLGLRYPRIWTTNYKNPNTDTSSQYSFRAESIPTRHKSRENLLRDELHVRCHQPGGPLHLGTQRLRISRTRQLQRPIFSFKSRHRRSG